MTLRLPRFPSSKLLDPEILHSVLSLVCESFSEGRTELAYETPFQLLVAVMLSAQTTDVQVNRITPPLFARIRTPADLVAIAPEEIESLVRSVNYYRTKARHIVATARRLASEYNGTIPSDLETLRTFPWIGIKTAKVVLSILYDAPYIGVDTHVHRVCNRIGIVETRMPEETDRAIAEVFARETSLWSLPNIHHAMVLFGRYICTAKNPKCPACPVRPYCRYYSQVITPYADLPPLPAR